VRETFSEDYPDMLNEGGPMLGLMTVCFVQGSGLSSRVVGHLSNGYSDVTPSKFGLIQNNQKVTFWLGAKSLGCAQEQRVW
jgi:hypothetical protein